MAVEVKFGTYDFVRTVEEWRERTNIIIDGSSVPKRDGVVMQGGKLGPREFELRGTLVSTTVTGLRTLRDALRVGVLKKTANLTLNDDRFIECRVGSYADDFIGGSALLALNFTISFISTLPYFMSQSLQSSGITTATTSGNTDFQVTNNGNHIAFATVTIVAPAGGISNNLIVDNLTTGKQFQFIGDITAGESLVISSLVVPPTVLNNAVNAIAFFTGDFLKIDPGTNNFRMTSEIDTTIKVEWYDTWV